MQYKGKLMNETWENGKMSDPILAHNFFYVDFTTTSS